MGLVLERRRETQQPLRGAGEKRPIQTVTGPFITGLRDDEEVRSTPQRTPALVFVLVGRSCGLMGHRQALGGREAQRVDLINNRTYP